MTLPGPGITRYACVTGAGYGIGEAVARRLAAAGHSLVLIDAPVPRALARTLHVRHGVDIETWDMDYRDDAARRDVANALEALDVSYFVNACGDPHERRPLHIFDPLPLLESQSRTAVELTRAVVPGMRAREAGGILGVGCAQAGLPHPEDARVTATTTGTNAFFDSLHAALAPRGVHCTLVLPALPGAPGVPAALRTTAETAAAAGLRALARNRRRVSPGVMGALSTMASTVVPGTVLAPRINALYNTKRN